ncbi:KDGP aldolase, partial [Klebsiella pneumoniae]
VGHLFMFLVGGKTPDQSVHLNLTTTYFPMGGLKHRAEFEAVAKACAAHDFWLEPTGGIDLENYSEILKIALDAGVSKIIPHIYSSIIDKASGNTRPADVRQLLEMTKQLVK